MTPQLKDQVVVVTGASSGIGRATALRFGKAGAQVVLAARNVVGLQEVADIIRDSGGEALVVSQFTLYGDVRKGRRPSWNDAARPEHAEPLVEAFAAALEGLGIRTARGRFGAHMRVELLNDGPVTLIVDSVELERPRRSKAND